ncbi:MAG: asparagine synthase (glutamine-hydrolyzing) [Sedimentisphaerales bacterium]|nr:asparagine synthase (glutamine-hydrolyzing) [Sedimentisphaerales bacterium]
MCGIAGLCRLSSPRPIDLDCLQKMVAVQRHRGPDETGFYLDDWIGLGHVRLSIIDLAGGSQPIHNEDGSLWIIYNGEVFNYPDLREDLLSRGHRFYTTSDTEVILHLYEEKGPQCLEDLNGQFGLAVWDAKKRELFLARDRIGIRPVHYAVVDGQLAFSSEIKALFQISHLARRIDPIAMDQIFTFWTTLPGRTAFEGVHELPAGHYMLVRNGQLHVHRYWDIPLYPRQDWINAPIEEIIEEIDALLTDAIRIRLRADVPVGCYLSGGLDSSGITSRVARRFNNRVKSFGIRFEHPDFDEGEYQNRMVDYLGVDHREIYATNEQIARSFPDVIRHGEKPILRTAPTPLFLLSRLVNESGFKVVLTGEGADEFFGGYNIFRETKVRRFWARQPDSESRPKLLNRLYPYIFKDARLETTLQSFFSRSLYKTESPLFSHLVRWENTSRIKALFSAHLKSQIGDYSADEELCQTLPVDLGRCDPLSKAQYLEAKIFLSNYLLSSQGDRVAMAHSLEIRLPYLDRRLMELMMRVPPRWKILGLDEKHILKRVLADDLPEAVLQRPKHPYRAPIRESLFAGGQSESRELLSEDLLHKAGLFDPNKVRLLLQKTERSGPLSEMDNMALVGLVSSQLLWSQFVDGSPAPDTEVARTSVFMDARGGRDPLESIRIK